MDIVQKIIQQSFTCEICGKCFSKKPYKNRHIQIVDGDENLFECNICHKSYGHKNELKGHVERNHEKKHHSCDFCSKIFTSFGVLTNHIKNIHERTTSHKCDFCGKTFTRSQACFDGPTPHQII